WMIISTFNLAEIGGIANLTLQGCSGSGYGLFPLILGLVAGKIWMIILTFNLAEIGVIANLALQGCSGSGYGLFPLILGLVAGKRFVDPKHPNKVCKLQRSIYGLKQASRSWNKRFDEEIKKTGFTHNPDEPCVYLKASGSNVAFLVLNLEWKTPRKGYTPMMEKLDYRKSQGAKTPTKVQRMQRVPYASAIGSIVYAVRCTRPDVVFAQNLCSHFQQNPDELKVSCYAAASFQTDSDDTKSQTGYVFVLNVGAVDWKSATQSTTAISPTEAEYIVAAEASMEAVWMIKFINGL
nr:retrotransposon protein, putative, Ty1-copia subclass [Tanacetum cinerariifolium]